MTATAQPRIKAFNLFPTRLVTLSFGEVVGLNTALCELIDGNGAARFDMHPDSMNLLTLAASTPAIERLREMFMQGLREWWSGTDAARPEQVDLTLFSNYAAPGELTLAHNHNADIVGVYYARSSENLHSEVCQPGEGDDYFETGNGQLVLHDPRFNANLAATGFRDYVRVLPRPGLMLIFPAYVWHTVTPHLGDFRRLSFSMNFTLKWTEKANIERRTIAW